MVTAIAVVYFSALIVWAHFLTPAEYNWRIHTVSELGAQQYRRKAVMQAGLMGFGLLLATGLAVDIAGSGSGGVWVRKTPVLLYALSVGLSGWWCTKPFDGQAEYSVRESAVHSFLAQAAGLTFCTGLLLYAVLEPDTGRKLIHAGFLVYVTACSAMFGLFPAFRGISQRIMFAGSFIWLVWFSS